MNKNNWMEIDDSSYVLYDGSVIYEKRTGYRACMCFKCKNINYIPIDVTRFIDIDSDEVDHYKIMHICKDCSNVNTYSLYDLIDPNIAEAISYFNKAGIETKFSCEGNNNNYPYIYFSDNTFDKYANYLPDSWYIDNKDVTDFDRYIIRCKYSDINNEKALRKKAIHDICDVAKRIYEERK